MAHKSRKFSNLFKIVDKIRECFSDSIMKNNLQAYYDSQHWSEIKLKVKETYPDGCILTDSLQYDVHHLNYLTLEREKIGWDIFPLDRFLHEEFHRWAKLNQKGFYDLEAFAKHKGIKLSNSRINRLRAAKAYNLELRKNNKSSNTPKKKYKKKKNKVRRGKKGNLHYLGKISSRFQKSKTPRAIIRSLYRRSARPSSNHTLSSTEIHPM